MTQISHLYETALKIVQDNSSISDLTPSYDELKYRDLHSSNENSSPEQLIQHFINSSNTSKTLKHRLYIEFFGLGPLEELIEDPSIEDIFIGASNEIYFYRSQQLHSHKDQFLGEISRARITTNILDEAKINLNLENPAGDGYFRGFRVHAMAEPLTAGTQISLRKNSRFSNIQFPETFAPNEIQQKIHNYANHQANILIVGKTGCGKTSYLNHLLQQAAEKQRCIALEETPEIQLPNNYSMSLNTVEGADLLVKKYTLMDLLRESLRMRPDRIILGEIRGEEAKDYLMALSTGHKGCLSTIHASSAREALIRLEMLVQLGAPNWSINSIQKLISMSLDYIIVLSQDHRRGRYLKELVKVEGQDMNSVLLNALYEWE